MKINCDFDPQDTLVISDWASEDNLVLTITQDDSEVNFKLNKHTWRRLRNHIESIIANEC